MDVGGDYVPTAVSSGLPEHFLADQQARPLLDGAWVMMASGACDGHHLHHWHGGEIAAGACVYIGAAPWNPDSVLIPGGDIISAVIERLNQCLEVARDDMQRLFGREGRNHCAGRHLPGHSEQEWRPRGDCL